MKPADPTWNRRQTVVFHFSADVFQACPCKLRRVIDSAVLQMVLGVLTGWLDRREREAVAYLIEENRLLRRQLGSRRLRSPTTNRRRWRRRRLGLQRSGLRPTQSRSASVQAVQVFPITGGSNTRELKLSPHADPTTKAAA